MIDKILVPLDGSEIAEQGLVAACRVARQTHATIVLVRAVAFYAVERDEESAEHLAVAEADRYLRALRLRLLGEGFTARTLLLPGDPVRAILFAAQSQHADLVCMSTHGERGIRQVLLGSVAEAVLRKVIPPVLLVRGFCQPADQSLLPFRKILAPLDGTMLGEQAVSYLVDTHLADAAEVTLLRAVAPRTMSVMAPMVGTAVTELYEALQQETVRDQEEAEQYLSELGRARLRHGAWRVDAAVGSPAAEIQRAARATAADLVVMVAHGRHGLDLLLHGSITREVLHQSETPILLLRGGAKAPAVPQDDSRPIHVLSAMGG